MFGEGLGVKIINTKRNGKGISKALLKILLSASLTKAIMGYCKDSIAAHRVKAPSELSGSLPMIGYLCFNKDGCIGTSWSLNCPVAAVVIAEENKAFVILSAVNVFPFPISTSPIIFFDEFDLLKEDIESLL